MLEIRTIKASDIDILEQNCTFCLTQFVSGNQVVQCPADSCSRWYHVGCWNANDNHCAFWGCAGNGVPNTSTNNELSEQKRDSSDINYILDHIEIIEQTINRTNLSDIHDLILQDWDYENLNPSKHIEITDWEINLADAAKKTHLLYAFDRLGLPKVLGKYERTEYYWVALGFFAILLIA